MMTLRKKTYLVIMSVTAALFMFAYFVLSQFLLRSYIVLEEKHTAESMGRIVSAIRNEFDGLHILQGDWALWDDTYHFVQHLNTDYSYNNLSYEALSNLKLNFIVFLDTSGKIVFGKGIDLVNKQEMPVPTDLIKQINNDPTFFSHTNITKTNIGFLQSDQGLILISSRPITKSDGKEPTGGNLIMGRYFNTQEIAHLSDVTHLPLRIVITDDTLREKTVFDEVTKKPVFIRPENDRTVKAWSSLDDIYGQQVALLELELPRDIYQQGRVSIMYLLLSIVVIGLVFAGIILLMMEKLVLSRLVRIGASVNQISMEGNISLRIFMEGNDELLILSNKINEMLDTLEKSQKEIQISEEKFRNIYDKMPIGLVMFDREGNIFGANKAFLDIVGVDRKEKIIEKNIFADPNFRAEIREQIFSAQTACFELEYDFDLVKAKDFYCTSRSGKQYLDWVINPIQVKSLSLCGFIGQVQNITQRKHEEEQLKYLSFFDNLSGLYNRAFFEDEVIRLESQGIDQVSVIMCDVDGLKLANDSFGHGAGDSLLKAAAQALRDCFRKEDIVARIGGDEFAVLLPGADLSMVERARDRIQAAVEIYNQTYQPVIPLRISLGLATTKGSNIKIKDLLKEADYNMYREKMHHQQSGKNDLVQTLTKAMKARDLVFEWHGERLQNLVVELARKFGLPESMMADLRLFAQFHDIGKVGVLDSILFKPGKLTENESSEMQRHCEIGFRIAQSSQNLMPIANWILYHHEWWNGSGYPYGIKGEEIPIESRILSVVVAYDSMTNNRPYRKEYSHDQAVKEIKRGAGVQFDPTLVDIFINIVKGRESLSRRYITTTDMRKGN